MGDKGTRKPKKHEIAIRQVERWVAEKIDGARTLTPDDLVRYKTRKPVCGWRIPFTLSVGARQLDLLIPHEFPRKAPRVALVEVGSDPNLIPHVEEDGVLCLTDDMASVADDDPLGTAQHMLASANSLLNMYLEGGGDQELRKEFRTYWSREKTEGAPPVLSLLRGLDETRGIVVWRGRGVTLVAETEEDATRWLRHRFPDLGEDPVLVSGVFLWMKQALIPAQFPSNGQQVLALCDSPQERRPIEQAAGKSPSELFIVLGCRQEEGVCLACVSFTRPPHPGKGFRPAKKWMKFFASVRTLTRRIVHRVDGLWIHGRGKDARYPRLAEARVIVIGCGSVGAPAAIALADAGVGSLTLIDPQALESANIGRHPLGADSIGVNKAIALRQKVLMKLPHMADVAAFDVGWQEALSNNSDLFSSADLILSATGIWAEEGALNEWHVAGGREIPVIYGWTEAHAVAGHALAIKSNGGCLRCGTSPVGVRRLRVSKWPKDSEQLESEPGCGGLYQPYGPVELMTTIGLVAEMALDVLLDDGARSLSSHHVWAAREVRTQELGGLWTDEWKEIVGNNGRCSLTRELPWSVDPSCPDCQ